MVDLEKIIRRGEVWVCDFDMENGENSTQHILKRRFGLVISSDEWNLMNPTYPIVLPLSLSDSMRGTGVTLRIANDKSIVSYVRTNCIQSMSVMNFISFKGNVSKEKMDEIDQHLIRYFGLDYNKYLERIAKMELQLNAMAAHNQSLINALSTNNVNDGLVAENKRLQDTIASLQKESSSTSRTFSKFNIKLNKTENLPQSEGPTVVHNVSTNVPTQSKERSNRSCVTKKQVSKYWSILDCNKFLNTINTIGRKGAMEEYGIISNSAYRNIVDECRNKVKI